MKRLFDDLFDQVREPFDPNRGVSKDNSILLIYPPERELDFREYLRDTFIHRIASAQVSFRMLDLSHFLFDGLDDTAVESLQADEFDDYRWMQQGLSQHVEKRLLARLEKESSEVPGGTVLVAATSALHPLLRFGELLRGLRHLRSRIALAFPGEERGGKLHFMNQLDGGNYLALKIVLRS